jgi:hypothetical protein
LRPWRCTILRGPHSRIHPVSMHKRIPATGHGAGRALYSAFRSISPGSTRKYLRNGSQTR